MKTLRFENLIDTNTGKTLEIEVPNDFDENNPESTLAGNRGAEFGARIKAVAKQQYKDEIKARLHSLREVKNLDEVGELGKRAGQKLFDEFGKGG